MYYELCHLKIVFQTILWYQDIKINFIFIIYEVVTCGCMHVVSLRGNEKCQYNNTNEFTRPEMCYVQLPSNCKDLSNSTLYPGLQMSEIACTRHQKKLEIFGKSFEMIEHINKS